ncbi:unnamed protein product [marine sediment metagenome]|uniref:VOC domain-containing protein n=1 Tax=marine sediment metagenome TaxID=412755 RepID=X1GR58_9ZZZZ
MIKNFRHIGIVIKDINKSLQFYQNILGFRLLKKSEENSSFIDTLLQLTETKLTTYKLEISDGTIVELLDYEDYKEPRELLKPNDIGITHFAFTVENLDNLYKNLLQNNVEVLSRPQLSPDNYARVFFCRDFENNLIELVEEIK